MKYLFPTLLLFILLSACRSRPEVTIPPSEIREKVVERLVPYALPEDSTRLTALLECDSLNQVIIKELNEVKSGKIQSDLSLDGGKFSYGTYHPPDTVYVPAKDSIVYRKEPYPVEVPIKVNELTREQTFQVWIARTGEAVLLIYFLFGIGGKWKGLISLIKKLIKN